MRGSMTFLALLCLCFCYVVHASHFRYAAYTWTRLQGQTIEFYTEQARRWSYPPYGSSCGRPKPTVDPITSGAGGVVYNPPLNVIDMTCECLCGCYCSNNRHWNWGDGTRTKMMTTVASIDENEDWVLATQTVQHTYPSEGVYNINFGSCCRIGSLLDSNAGQYYYTRFKIDTRFSRPGTPTRSVASKALPIIYFRPNVQTTLQVPVTASNAPNAPTFTASPSGTSGSGLVSPTPPGLTLQSNGVITWQPTQKGLYAYQLTISDQFSSVALDLILNVDECPNGGSAPYFVKASPPTIDVFIGVETVVNVVVRDTDNDAITMTPGSIPDGAVILPTSGCQEGSNIGQCTKQIRWTPTLGQVDSQVCFSVYDSQNCYYPGLYCVTLRIGEAKILYVSGIVRDFHMAGVAAPAIHNPDFDRAVPTTTEPNFVSSQIGADAKPVYTGGAGTLTTSGATNFNQWWNTIGNVSSARVLSLTLSNAGQADQRIFSFASTAFHPIDDLSFGNEGDAHNNFFTYEIHTYITVNATGGEKYEFKSSDDLWIFIDGKLAVDLHGIHDSKTATLDMDSYSASNGLVKGETYRVDIFFAHRGGGSHIPQLQLQLNDAALCNALSSGITQVNFPPPAGFTSAASSLFLSGQAADSSAGVQGSKLRLTESSLTGSSAVWFASSSSGSVVSQQVKFLNGFRSTFSFRVTSPGCEGFAFVLQGAGASERGGGGSKLGYDGIASSIAIEFDMATQLELGDPGHQHMSVHSRFLQANSVDETYSLGTSESTNLHFDNGTTHYVVIEYTPAQDDDQGGPLLGWIRVFLGTTNAEVQVVPFLQVQVDGTQLKNLFPGSQGFVGFTAGSSDSRKTTLEIDSWTMVSVPPSAVETSTVGVPQSVIAGKTGHALIQLRDACANPIRVGADGSRFNGVLTSGGGNVLGPPSPTISASITDNQNGTYTFSYAPTVAGQLNLAVTFDGEAIKSSPFPLEVRAGSTSSAQSTFIYGVLPERYSNFPIANTSSGVWVVQFRASSLDVVDSAVFATQQSSERTRLTNYINGIPSGIIVAVVVKGSAWSSAPPAALVTALVSLGATSGTVSSLAAGQAYALIGSVGSVITATDAAGVSARTPLLSVTVGSKQILARSAGTSQGDQGYVQVKDNQKVVAAGSNVTFTITARDAYGNAKTDGSDNFNVFFIPSITDVNGELKGIKHVGNGNYEVSFYATKAADISMYVQLGSQNLPNSPYAVKVVGGVADPLRTRCTGDGLFSAVSDQPASFKVLLRDIFDNPITTDSASVSAKLTATGIADVTASNIGWDYTSNTYNFTYSARVATTYLVVITVNGVEVPSTVYDPSPFTPNVLSGPVSPTNSLITAVEQTAVAGGVLTFSVQERDAAGNKVSTSPVVPTVGYSTSVTSTSIVFFGNGLYSVRFTPLTVGALTVTPQISGQNTLNGTLSYSVSVGALSVASYISGLDNSQVNTNTFRITAMDLYGNPRTGKNDTASFHAEARSTPGGAFHGTTVSIVQIGSSENYTVTWQTNTAATYIVTAAILGVGNVANSGAQVVLSAGKAAFAACQVAGSGLVGGTGGNLTSFTITSRDQYLNVRLTGTDFFNVTISPLSAASYAAKSITPIGSGQYAVTYEVPPYLVNRQIFVLTVELSSRSEGSPASGIVFNATANTLSPTDLSYARVNFIPTLTAGSPSTFNIENFDSGGNVETAATTFTVRISGPEDVFAAVSASTPAGTYQASFTPNLVGNYSVRVFERGVAETEQTKSAPVWFVVKAGPVSPTQSIVTGFPAVVEAGKTGVFTVSLRDANGNAMDVGGKTITLLPDTPDIQLVSQQQNSDFTYSCTYNGSLAGAHRIQVQEGGASLGTGTARYELTISPTAIAGSHTTNAGDAVTAQFVAGQTKDFITTTRDRFNNLVDDSAFKINVTLIANGSSAVVSTQYGGAGRFVTTLRPTVAGTHTLYVEVNGQSTIGTPKSVIVSPSTISSDLTTITGLSSVRAGQAITFNVDARDRYNNKFVFGVNQLTVKAIGPLGQAVATVSGPNYDVSFASTQRIGTYTFEIIADNVVLNKPVVTTVTHNVAYGPNTVLSDVNPSTVGVLNNFTIQTRDQYQNDVRDSIVVPVLVSFKEGSPTCETGDEAVVQTVSTRFTSVSATSTGNGGYVVKFIGQQSGSFTANLTVNGLPLPCESERSVLLNSGPLQASNTKITCPNKPNKVTAGSKQCVTVTAYDQFNNLVGRSGDTITIPSPTSARDLSTANNNIQNVTVTTSGDGTYTLCFIPTKSDLATWNLRVSANGVLVPNPSCATYSVDPGTVGSFVAFLQGPYYAGQTNSFVVQGTDVYGNQVENADMAKGFTYSATFTSTNSNLDYTLTGTAVFSGLGNFTVSFFPFYSSVYEASIQLFQGGEKTSSKTIAVTVLPATCGAINPATPYRCPISRQCVASYASCTDIDTVRCNSTSFKCADGSCAANALLCPCKAGQKKCTDGQCVDQSTPCLEAAACSTGFTKCADGSCRSKSSDCPSPRVCNPGYALCPDGESCAPFEKITYYNMSCTGTITTVTDKNAFSCPGSIIPVVQATFSKLEFSCDTNTTNTACPLPHQRRCPSGACVERVEDCPTRVTCASSSHVVCPDGTCRDNVDLCPPIESCPQPQSIGNITFGKFTRCPDGSCRQNKSDCPTQVTCPIGWVKCESGKCAQSLASCPQVAFPTCSVGKVRCPSGDCVENALFCPSLTTCPTDRPVLCPDRECKATAFECNPVNVCPTTAITCPDGTCVANETHCPTQISCPLEASVLCEDNDCKQSREECPTRPACPSYSPTRCPDGACRTSISDCASYPSCPLKTPVKCLDNSCQLSVDKCQTYSQMKCAPGLVRCPGGECQISYQLCPTHVTCKLGTQRCLDGTCRTDCASVTKRTCPSGEVACPQAGQGTSCALSLDQCPLAFVCTERVPVRCSDNTCKGTVAECSDPGTIPANKFSCPGGGAESSSERCSTPVTCSPEAPIKCWDDTCRKDPRDCPPFRKCPTGQYVCPDGSCAQRLHLCRSLSTSCTGTKVRCWDGICRNSVAECSTTNYNQFAVTTIQCPHGGTRCRDGSCRGRRSLCEAMSCPKVLPHLCDNGECVLEASKCYNQTTGCPGDEIKCLDGSCVPKGSLCTFNTSCPTLNQNNQVRCPDGSCRLSKSSCPSVNGCSSSQIRCHDGSCQRKPTSTSNRCSDGTDTANSCPAHRPVRCPGGFCSVSITLCPPDLSSTAQTACPTATPVRCSNGECKVSDVQCPTLRPCESGEERCGDGSCRTTGDCPAVNKCPLGHFRCPNGLCWPTGKDCFSATTGCCCGGTKCSGNGGCVLDTNQCPTIQARIPLPNGCDKSTPYKCFNGDCVQNSGECLVPSTRCPKTQPFRCLNGTCLATSSLCDSFAFCPSSYVTCADGSCVKNYTLCTSKNGCPVSAPIRCADGSCKKYTSTSLSDYPTLSCPVTITCDSSEVRCADGTCAVDAKLCPSFEPCPNATPELCLSHRKDQDVSRCRAIGTCPVLSKCPSSTPVTCANGECKETPSQCTIPSVCTDKLLPFECMDGSCQRSRSQCAQVRGEMINTTYSSLSKFIRASHDGLCGGTAVMCSDGSCQPEAYLCGITPPCVGSSTYRCADGSCQPNAGSCSTLLLGNGISSILTEPRTGCPVAHTRCPDGTCRKTCLPYDGCLPGSYMCPDHSCTSDPAQCALPSNYTNPLARRLLAVSTTSTGFPCLNYCNRDVKATLMTYTIDRGVTQDLIIAENDTFVTSARLILNSGSVTLHTEHKVDNISLSIRPVADSTLRLIPHSIDPSRRSDFKSRSSLTFSEAVLSSAFECTLSSDVVQPLPVNFTYTAVLDTPFQTAGLSDICLAWSKDGSQWQCTQTPETRERVFIYDSSNPGFANATLARCESGLVYAFVFMPLRVPPSDSSDGGSNDWLKDNWYILFPSMIGGIIFFVLMWMTYTWLYSFRKKYHETREKVDTKAAEVEDMEMFGVDKADPDALMMSNPLAQQPETIKGTIGLNNMLKDTSEKNHELQDMHEDKVSQIQALSGDNDALQSELDAMKRELEFRNRGDTQDLSIPAHTAARPLPHSQQLPFSQPAPSAPVKKERNAFESVQPKKKRM